WKPAIPSAQKPVPPQSSMCCHPRGKMSMIWQLILALELIQQPGDGSIASRERMPAVRSALWSAIGTSLILVPASQAGQELLPALGALMPSKAFLTSPETFSDSNYWKRIFKG